VANYRALAPGQGSQVWVGGPAMAEPELLFETSDVLIEAPNWSLDGANLLVNGNGALWRIAVDSPQRGLARIEYDDLPGLNNDHVLDPDGKHIYMSAMDGHIYYGHLDGGAVQRVTPDDGKWHFLHGVSPDGKRLAYVEIDTFGVPGKLAVIEPHGAPTALDTGTGHIDGPEWSPDGDWIYFNTEGFTDEPGHAQLARIPDAGGAVQQLVASDTVDWFPHLSPDSRHATYIAFPAGTLGHPADLDVEVRVVATEDWSDVLQRYELFGGQGTINVNSWSPDSTRFAFVAYPIRCASA
jgi:TolB protein